MFGQKEKVKTVKKFFILCSRSFFVRFTEVNSGRNSRAGPGKSIRFKEVSALESPLWRGFVIRVSKEFIRY